MFSASLVLPISVSNLRASNDQHKVKVLSTKIKSDLIIQEISLNWALFRFPNACLVYGSMTGFCFKFTLTISKYSQKIFSKTRYPWQNSYNLKISGLM